MSVLESRRAVGIAVESVFSSVSELQSMTLHPFGLTLWRALQKHLLIHSAPSKPLKVVG